MQILHRQWQELAIEYIVFVMIAYNWLLGYTDLKKVVVIEFTEQDIRKLQDTIVALERSSLKSRDFSLRGWIRNFKRVDTTKLLVSKKYIMQQTVLQCVRH